MTAQEKIAKLRALYITRYSKEPTVLIIGYESSKILQDSCKNGFCGMRVIVDKDKPRRVEVGDLEV